ncbi:MAG TPA: gamma carbonic anhydrase family protein [Ignavibacteria bacterium]|nr:gamma carbonic anhydrase family protein [Ignavibacteria bacterium]
MKEGSSLWFNTVVRGDVHFIKIGRYTNIQDCSMLHVTNNKYPLILGNNITVGHSVTLHGCTINDECLIGMGAIILDGAKVNKHSIVAAGAVVTQGFEVPEGKVVAGVPCRIMRDVTKDEIEEMNISALRYFNYAEKTLKSFAKIAQTT